MDAYFPAAGLEYKALQPDDIADIPFAVFVKAFLADIIDTDIRLYAPRNIGYIDKVRLAHIAAAHKPAGKRNFLLIELFEIILDFARVRGNIVFCNGKRIPALRLRFGKLAAPHGDDFVFVLQSGRCPVLYFFVHRLPLIWKFR